MNPQQTLEDYFATFREHIIGNQQVFESPFGEKQILYADWTASGRAYGPIEDFIQQHILPFVANTHTETTVTGTLISKAYEEAKVIVKQHVCANENDVLIFCGSGMTAAVNKLQRILGLRMPDRMMEYVKQGSAPLEIDEELRPVVFITHMEHHSNQTSWLETIATVEIIDCDEEGQVDLTHFGLLLAKYAHRKNKIAAVTACSNVTGIETPYHEIAEIIHAHGGFCFVDFACSAPYVNIDMHPEGKGAYLDTIYFSPHKFLGGPGTPGVLIFNKKCYKNNVPDHPGGGTITYSNPWRENEFTANIEQREDGGTPPFLQAIKAAMCMRLKEAMGVENIMNREKELLKIVFARFSKISNAQILQGNIKNRLGVVSFIITGAHYNLIVKLLNDRFGIQTRGGCSCAGTYGHKLLKVGKAQSHQILNAIRSGNLFAKPGWVRLSVHPTMTDAEINFMMDAIEETALHFEEWGEDYVYDGVANEYVFKGKNVDCIRSNWFDYEVWTELQHARGNIALNTFCN
jgi:selenocysteine lyase/cysteine desulfurase